MMFLLAAAAVTLASSDEKPEPLEHLKSTKARTEGFGPRITAYIFVQVDPDTGCQYITTFAEDGAGGLGITPRLDRSGQPICGSGDGSEKAD